MRIQPAKWTGGCTMKANIRPNLDGSVRSEKWRAEAVVKIVHPKTRVGEDIGLADHDPDKEVPYLVFSPRAPMQSRQFITAICLNPDAVPKFEVLEDKKYLGVRMQTHDAVEEMYLNVRAVHSPGTLILIWAAGRPMLTCCI